jgi:ABC-type nickel/cobalt efflux system permease component RcnA
MSESSLPVNSDMVLRFGTLKDRSGIAITTATVTVQEFKDELGATPGGITLPLAMSHIGLGVYEAAISDAIAVVANQKYAVKLRAVSGTLQREWTHTVKAIVGTA